MSIKTTLICDKCEKKLELSGPYHVAKAEMKEKGWKNKKNESGEWEIVCKGCGE